MQPHVLKINSYIKDTRDFILKIENCSIQKQSVLLSLGVVSLYTSIPHDEIRNTMQTYLENDFNVLPSMFFILDLVDILLERNYFSFQGDYYFQTQGVLMGSPFAPSVANLFMANLENTIILNSEHNPFFSSIFLFYHFIDCFCVLL